ncbi:MAG: UMP kinase [Clostridia bacterium]|nr:UMP kinase [Clostridia bacterium]
MYKRILIKVSGEALADENGFGIGNTTINELVEQLKVINKEGIQVGIVIGGGNFWRGRQGGHMDRSTADHMGMLATLINALALQDALEGQGVPVRVQSALNINRIAEPYILRRAIRHLEKGRIVIFACGTGNPYFSSDSGAALRAAEINADVLLLAKNIDGIYSADPKVDASAVKFDEISYMDVIQKGLKAMDTTAISMCMENNIPILAFGVNEKDSIIKAVKGDKIGTIIK